MLPYINYTEAKINYSRIHNIDFLYRPQDLNTMEPMHPYYYKVYALLNLMTNNRTNVKKEVDWIVFIDADAYISEFRIPLHSLIYTAQEWAMTFGDNIPCEFISQDSKIVVNTGFWMVRNSSKALEFVREWIEEIESPWNDVLWTDEQGCLQNLILKKAINLTDNKIVYHNQCWRDGIKLQRNICWGRYMKQINLPPETRKIGPFCILPREDGIPTRHHSRESVKYMGELVYHKKGLSREVIERSSVLDYDHVKQKIIFPDGLVVKHTIGHKSKRALYLIENQTFRQFPDFNTFAKMGYDIDLIVYLDGTAFNQLPLGLPLPAI
jgi:hypothetical protein